QSAGHRPVAAAVRQPQSALCARGRADLRQIYLRAPAIHRFRFRRAKAAGRDPGTPSHLVLRRMDRLRLSRGRPALGPCGRRSARRLCALAQAAGCACTGCGVAEMTAPDPAALYFGEVMHARLKPKPHRFNYRVMSLLIDLGRLDDADRMSPLFAVNRRGLYSFHDKDHGPRDGSPLRDYALSCADEHGGDLDGGRVVLLCYPRLLGFTFNPLSVYFCYRADGELALVIYEVRNTFGEIRPYVLPVRPGEMTAAGLRQEQ